MWNVKFDAPHLKMVLLLTDKRVVPYRVVESLVRIHLETNLRAGKERGRSREAYQKVYVY